jgi:hypothetical protein
MSWQPIETAPKDGTEIDVWHYCHDPKWRPDSHGIASGWRHTNVKWCKGNPPGWAEYNVEEAEWIHLPDVMYTTSHWMPIPEPPEPEKPNA